MTDFKKLSQWQGWPVIMIGVAILSYAIYYYGKVALRIVRLQEDQVVVCAGITAYQGSYKVSHMNSALPIRDGSIILKKAIPGS